MSVRMQKLYWLDHYIKNFEGQSNPFKKYLKTKSIFDRDEDWNILESTVKAVVVGNSD